jgi:outer membrane protein OmpA-like peptidoglycan-associated protein
MSPSVLLSLLVATAVAAPEQGATASVAGGYLFVDDDEEIDDGWAVSPRVGFTLGTVWTFEGELGVHGGQAPALSLPYTALSPRLSLMVDMAPDHWLQPFFLGGGGLLWRQVEPGAGGVVLPQSAKDSRFVRENPHSDFALNFGAGTLVRLSGPWFFRADVRSLIHFGESRSGQYPKEFGNWEVTGGLCFRGVELNRDDDRDGIVDRFDACPARKEDLDGFRDDDGCPDDDDDQDGVPDRIDQCKEEEEDRDNFEDKDGCPDPDNDRDGVADWTDRCPDEAEDKDGHTDGDGCPDDDNDGDGIPDDGDRCPALAEDRDGFDDGDGCPDLDNDKDGVGDDVDRCPTEPEVINGVSDEDGCPDDKPKEPDTFNGVIRGINFETGSDRLTPDSFRVLDEVAVTLVKFPAIRIEVQGHTDADGPDAKNLTLSARRARTVVEYLINRGVHPDRLEYVGYGETKPIVPNSTKANKAINRRVEFRRLDTAG